MSLVSGNLLTLSNTHARELAGRCATLGRVKYRFKDYDPNQPGQPPWRSGAEGKAYPLLGPDGCMAAYLKFFTHPTEKRLSRTAWLIGQEMHAWLPGLTAAPLKWVDTRQASRPTGLDFDFAGYFAHAVPGETWLELKNRMAEAGMLLDEEIRWRCVMDLILAVAMLEQSDLVHGDLSPNNIVVDLNARPEDPALYLIDFDAFVAAAAGEDRAVTVAEGGTYGTEGYCPPDLAARANCGDTTASPYSDRYGRDMLILELLFMDRDLLPDDAPVVWDTDRLNRRYTAWRARCEPAHWQALAHLDPATAFVLREEERPASRDLAAALGLLLPPRPALRPAAQLWRPPGGMSEHRRRTVPAAHPNVATTPAVAGQTHRRQQRTGLFELFDPNRPKVPAEPSTAFGEIMLGLLAPWGCLLVLLAVLCPLFWPVLFLILYLNKSNDADG